MSEPILLPSHQWGVVTGDAARPLLSGVVTAAQEAGAEFCDVRLSETEEMRLYAVSGVAPDERVEGHAGIGVRVLVNGVWGFASRPLRDENDVHHVVNSAIANARAGREGSAAQVTLPPHATEIGFYQTDADIDPFGVSASERERLVLETLAAARGERGVVRAQAGVNAKRQHRYFANSEGSLQEQHFVETGAMVLAVASDGHIVQRRSFPNSFHGNTAAAGWDPRHDVAPLIDAIWALDKSTDVSSTS